MSSDTKNKLLLSMQHLLGPLVRLLLRHGVSFAEFEEVARLAYVQAANEHFRLPNRKMSDSRIAVLTGLTRKEVKRLRDLIDAGELSNKADNAHRATRVLSGWHRDPDFCGSDGYPLNLPMEGERGFSGLVRRYSGDIPAKAMLEELLRVKAVAACEDGESVKPLSRIYMPLAADDPASIRILGTSTRDLLSTLEHNMTIDADEPRFLQRSVSNNNISPKMVPIFNRIATEQSQSLLESLDDWLTAHELDERDVMEDEADSRVGVGVYFFRNPR
mgnify:CR=1 FL=1